MIKTNILFKTDTTKNWQIQEDDFQSLKGEIYFYIDHLDTNKVNHNGNKIYYSQLKIGNGLSKLTNLPFLINDYITDSQIEEIFKSNSILGISTLGSLILN